MTARFIPSDYPGGRIVLLSGAVFPPAGQGQHRNPWVWRLWVHDGPSTPQGEARTELAAKTALLSRWRDFTRRAELTETREETANG